MAVARAARVFAFSGQPTQGMFHQCGRFPSLRANGGRRGTVLCVEEQHECCHQLLGRPSLGLSFQGMPVLVADRELLVQRLRQLLTLQGPFLWILLCLMSLHWTDPFGSGHPDAMQQRPRSPYQPIRWLHQLANLLATVSAAERLDPADDSLQARRLRQRLAAAQRLLDPLPAPLQASVWSERAVWQFLRWGGLGALLAVLLKR